MKIAVPEAVEAIIKTLNDHGFEAFAVGGCVRDTLLGREPEDWDITTSASPLQVKELFRRTIDTGIQHGTVTVMKSHNSYEVTTYRIDGEYEDGRHPKSVQFTASLTEDLQRRDFTINAMAYSHETGIVDEFGGIEDLKSGIIRCVGNPLERFTEDALRILRAIRFSAQLNFKIEPKTREGISTIAPNMENISKERIQAELTKLLLSDYPEKIAEVYETGISRYVSDAFHCADRSRLCIPSGLPKKKHIRWAAFLKDTEGKKAVQVLKDLKLDHDTIMRVRILNQWFYREIPPGKVQLRRAMSQMEPQQFDDLLTLKKWMGQTGIEELERLTEEIRKNGDCVSLKELKINGTDLLAAGIKPGKQIGEELSRLLNLVLEKPELNRKEILLKLLTVSKY